MLYYLFFHFVIHLSGGWIVVQTFHMCADVFLFSSYQVGRSGILLMGNGSCAHVLGVGTVILKFTREDSATKECATCSLYKEKSC
jgi:hypothetical protein